MSLAQQFPPLRPCHPPSSRHRIIDTQMSPKNFSLSSRPAPATTFLFPPLKKNISEATAPLDAASPLSLATAGCGRPLLCVDHSRETAKHLRSTRPWSRLPRCHTHLDNHTSQVLFYALLTAVTPSFKASGFKYLCVLSPSLNSTLTHYICKDLISK